MTVRNKKVFITGLGLLSAVIITVVSYKLFLQPNILSPVDSEIIPTPTVVEQLALWQDQSEFSFRYPSSLNLNPHEEDTENYAHVELTSATHSGNLTVWTQDTKATDTDDWIKKEKVQGAIDTTLATLPAKKFLNADDTKLLTTIVIRNGYLYKLEAKLSDGDYWNKVYDTVTSSFAFTPASPDTADEAIQPQDQEAVSEETAEVFDEVIE